jgi:hypothetical protein
MKVKLVEEFLLKQGLSGPLSKGSAHLIAYYYNINNITCTVVHFYFCSCVHPEDV